MIKLFKKSHTKKYTITFLNEKWETLKTCNSIEFIPRAHEIIYLPEFEKYFRVVNVVYNFTKVQGVFIIIEEYTDDFELNNEDKKNKKDGKN